VIPAPYEWLASGNNGPGYVRFSGIVLLGSDVEIGPKGSVRVKMLSIINRSVLPYILG
jgi:hypothetical protein